MAQIEVPFDDAPEEEIPKEGTYDLRVMMKEVGTSKSSGRPQITVMLKIEGDVDYVPIYHYLTFPTMEDFDEEPQKARNAVRRVARFCTVFGIEMGPQGFDDEALDGATGRCLVRLEEYEGEDRPKLQLPRIKS